MRVASLESPRADTDGTIVALLSLLVERSMSRATSRPSAQTRVSVESSEVGSIFTGGNKLEGQLDSGQ